MGRTTHFARVAVIIALVASALLAVSSPSSLAQDADPPATEDPPAPTPAADWVPYRGTYAVYCTLTNPDNPGCEVHHPTWAIDLATPGGTRIRSAGYGVILAVSRGCASYGGDGECNGGAGNMVIVSHGDYWSRYLHLSSIPKRVKVGRQVQPGTLLGRAGASGTFGGAHLHYDEYQPGPPSGRVAFGRMFACHGDQAVVYPDVLGFTSWADVPHGSLVRNDNYECSAHPEQPHPPAPQPPVYPKGPPLGIGGAGAVAVADTDGDGDMDLVVGVPGANLNGERRAGMVAVVDPFDRRQRKRLVQGQSMSGVLESGDLLGAAVSSGDFDCDGRADLAIGAPGEDLAEPYTDTGAVNVVFGTGENQLIYAGQGLDSYYMRPSDWVGAALAVGDFNADGCDDLAIGSPGADRSGGLDMGMVWAMSGSPHGLLRPTRLLQGVNLGGVLESHDQTGYALTSADFNCDGVADLAVGVPREGIDAAGAGAVLVTYGSSRGLRGGEVLYQGRGLAGSPAALERTGMALAGGDIDGDGCDDLAVGAPGEQVAGRKNTGAVLVTFGDADGLARSDRTLTLAPGSGLMGKARRGDRVGSSVVLADINCDGYADLATGAPGRNIRGRSNTGAVLVVSGSASGLDGPTGIVRQHRGLKGKLQAKAQVGSALVAADVDLDGCDDLVVSAPGAVVRKRANAGVVLIAFGSADGTKSRAPLRVDQRAEVPGRPTSGAKFGGASPAHLFKSALLGDLAG